MNTACVNPEMRTTALLQPDRRSKSGSALGIHRHVPSRLRLGNDQELNHMTTATWATHAYTPVLTIISCENKIPPG